LTAGGRDEERGQDDRGDNPQASHKSPTTTHNGIVTIEQYTVS
jgi:hypothetical protein